MKQTQFIKLFALGTLLSLTTIGCQSTKYGVTPLGDKPRGSNSEASEKSEFAQLPSEPGVKSDDVGTPLSERNHDGWIENAEMFKPYRVHFEYDSSLVSSTEKTKLEAIAEQLKANPGVAVKIEGHCDERGTEEYNRSLGERRALALREELIRLGIDPARVDTISYADNKPLVSDHTETSYRQNRRGEFVALSPK